MATASKHPPLSWSQTHDTVLVTVGVQDAADVQVNVEQIETGSVLKCSLRSTSGSGGEFACTVRLFGEVEPALSRQEIKSRAVHLALQKKALVDAWFWPRLTVDLSKNPNIQVDWAHWKDKEEIEQAASSRRDTVTVDDPSGAGELPLGLDSEEVRRTLAAVRNEQLRLKREQLAQDDTPKARAQTTSRELDRQLLASVPACGSASVPSDEGDDLPPLVA